jgi:hypothetical protein
MNKILMVIGILLGVLVLVVLLAILLTPWMDRWSTIPEERTQKFPGDVFVINPARTTNRGITINAPVQKIYPWILQIGADKSGMYSYAWLENLVGCKMAKDETIHSEWQNLVSGDLMKMCGGDFAPPPYIVAEILPNHAVTFGHKTDESWEESWQFVLIPQTDGTTRLVTRTSTNMIGGMWEIVRPISFVMERKMLLTIKDLSER